MKSLDQYQSQPLSLQVMNEFHRRLLTGVQDEIAGKVRNTTDQIEALLTELFNWLEANPDLPIAVKTGIFHHHFVYIHPYVDGNGRVCRLLTALIFLKHRYLINKYFVLDDYYDIDRMQYSDKLHSADSGDKTEWLEYFTEGIMFSLQAALGKVKEASLKLNIADRPTKNEQTIIKFVQERNEVTSTDIAKFLKISRQQAHSLLKSLVNKGFLQKQGKTKKSFYSQL